MKAKVTAYLDCGCAILEDGTRTWCPSCAIDGGTASALRNTTDYLERRLRLLEASIQRWATWACERTGLATTPSCQGCAPCQAREVLADLGSLPNA